MVGEGLGFWFWFSRGGSVGAALNAMGVLFALSPGVALAIL